MKQEIIEMPTALELIDKGLVTDPIPVLKTLVEGKYALAMACYKQGMTSLDSTAFEAVAVTRSLLALCAASEKPGIVSSEQIRAFGDYASSVSMESNSKHPRISGK